MRNLAIAMSVMLLWSSPTTAQSAYEVSVTRKAQNLYKVDARPFWIQTRYCYEYVYYEDSVLSAYSITFLDSGSRCDVKQVLQEIAPASGNYEVSVSQEDGDLFSTLDGIIFKASYCMELALNDDAIFRSTGYGGGSLHFLDSGRKCDVDQVLTKAGL